MNEAVSFLIQNNLITVCALVCIPAFLCVNKAIPQLVKKYFYIMLLILFVEGSASYIDYLLNIPSSADAQFIRLRMIVSVIGYVSRALLLYVSMLLMTRNSTFRYRKILLSIPTICTVFLSILALFTHQVFFYNEENHFQGGFLRYFYFVALIVYFIMILAEAVKKCKAEIHEGRILFGIIVLLSWDMVVAVVLRNDMIHEQSLAMAVILYFMHFSSIFHGEKVEELHNTISETEDRLTEHMLVQSIETLAYTIDAKDRYTRGHSSRVAKYARMIAMLDGKDEETCKQVYLAALLHDIGKISISDEIINKKGKLTDEEYEVIKQHPVYGSNIMEKMRDYPFLQNGAAYHHERYDGKGYPNGLKGMEIPEIARIISVADSYDAMTSYRSYRDVMDQAEVKQEIWMGMGTQFDPHYARVMISLIDSDLNYELRQKYNQDDEISFATEQMNVNWNTKVPSSIKEENPLMQETSVFYLGEYAGIMDTWADPSESILITEEGSQVSFVSTTDEDAKYIWYSPTAILFSSDEGIIQKGNYEELGVFVSAGYSWKTGPAVSQYAMYEKTAAFDNWNSWIEKNKKGMRYRFWAKRNGSVIRLMLENVMLRVEAELYLPEDYARDVYMMVTGERCSISDLVVDDTRGRG